MRKSLTNTCHFLLFVLVVLAGGCAVERRKVELQGSTPAPPTPQASDSKPTIAAAPVEEGEDGWQVASGDNLTLTVNAPGAKEVALLYRPVVAEQDGHLLLKKLTEPVGDAGEKFQTTLKPPEDFAGEVWAEATYPDGARKQTEQIALTTRAATDETNAGQESSRGAADVKAKPRSVDGVAGEDDSARSDKVTGGRVARATLRSNRPDIRITVNVPAFLLTLWQGGKEVATYHVGVGRKAFPIPVGEREATRIILNPAWIPPDSSWVRASDSVEPGERVPADDPRNPLGKIKIPLGDAYLIHEAARASDIGSLVSHGCVRMLTEDLFDLVERVARARSLDVTGEELEKARGDSVRRVIALGEPLPVDINYDTEVVEGGVLHVYPDVYGRAPDRVERLRADLRAAGVDASKLNDETLKELVGRANASEMFVVSVADVRRGRALTAGHAAPLVESAEEGGRKGRGKG